MAVSVVILLSMVCFVGFVNAFNTHRCLLHRKKCVDYCPRNMHAYHTRCDGETMSQRTCSSPETYVLGYTCGWSRCDCNGDKALDEDLGHCVDYYDCPAELTKKQRRRKKHRKGFRVPKVKASDLRPDPDLQHIRSEKRG